LDPHKTGFCPYPAGGLLYRNGNIRKFLAQTAAYVHHGQAAQVRATVLSHAFCGDKRKILRIKNTDQTLHLDADLNANPDPEFYLMCIGMRIRIFI
jgi:hypothetical protein